MTFKTPLAAIVLAAFSVFTSPRIPATAQERANPEAVLQRLFEAPEINDEWFAPEFLAQVPADQVADIITSMEEEFGSYRSVAGEGQRFTVTLERAEVPARLLLNAQGRITGLFFEAPIAFGELSQHVEAIAALPGRTAVLVLSNGEALAEHNADEPLAAGSAAKLAILKAVRGAVAEGRLNWDQVVPLEEEWRSLPTGILQDWPAGSPVTVATLANLMISISDNTATDALIHLVGREAIEAVSPRNAPFATTRELFILKAASNEELRKAWLEGDETKRRELLDRTASSSLPNVTDLVPEPTIEIEWFFSVRELCTLMEELAHLPALHISLGVAERENWREIAFKGGSEAGVLNFTTRVTDAQGTSHCIAATWNNAETTLDNGQLTSSYRAILRGLREE